MSAPRPKACPVCGADARRVYCSPAHRREAARRRRRFDPGPEAEAARARALRAIGGFGLTSGLEEIAAATGCTSKATRRTLRRRLRELAAAGRVGQVGSRYFPTSWLKP